MEYRPGKCSSCGAEYKIPASFQHDAAKCKQCDGVVRIGKVQSAGTPVPARKVAPARAAAPEPTPARPEAEAQETKKKKGDTLARLKAERAAQTGADDSKPGDGKKTASTLERLKAERSGDSGTHESKPAARSGSGASASTVRTGASARRRSGSSSRRRGKRDAGEEEGERGRRGARPKKSGPSPVLLGGLALLLIVGAGALYMAMYGGGDEPAKDAVAEESASSDSAKQETPQEEAPAPEPEEQEPEPEKEPEEEKPEPKPRKAGDPSTVDLTAIADFGPAAGTSSEEWAEITAKVDLFMADDGARSSRALRSLKDDYGREAVPAIINTLKTLQLGTEEGFRLGDVFQRTLQDICNGSNFGWRYTTEPEDEYYNKRVVENWAKSWSQVEISIEAWIKLAKLEAADPDEARRLRKVFGAGGGGQDDLFDDDFDVD